MDVVVVVGSIGSVLFSKRQKALIQEKAELVMIPPVAGMSKSLVQLWLQVHAPVPKVSSK